jgi:hypothetical protein
LEGIDIEMEIPRNDKMLQPNKKMFLAALAETGNITSASKLTNIARNTHYTWLKEDPAYAAAVEDAFVQAAENLEREARRRAVSGVDKPVYYKGEKVDTMKEYSDTLLIFLLKGAMPDKYSEKFQGSITNNLNISVELPENERKGRILEILGKKEAIETEYTVLDEPAEPEQAE